MTETNVQVQQEDRIRDRFFQVLKDIFKREPTPEEYEEAYDASEQHPAWVTMISQYQGPVV